MLKIPFQQTRILTADPVDVFGNSPAGVDGPNTWKLAGNVIPNGGNAINDGVFLGPAADGNTATVGSASPSQNPSLVEVSNTANGNPVSGSLEVLSVGLAVAINLVVS